MTRFTLSVATLFAVLSPAVGQDLRVVVGPPKPPENGWVPVYEWTVSWGLRDDTKATMGGLATYKTLSAAKQAAQKKLSERGKKEEWTYIKFVEVEGTPAFAEVSKLEPKLAKLWNAIRAGVDQERKTRACNLLVQDVAAAAGLGATKPLVKGAAGYTADQMWGYFNTVAEKDGWKEMKGEPAKGNQPTVSAIDAANRAADDGQLVIGVISKEALNKFKKEGRNDYDEGHVFVVTPGGGTDWKSTLTANEVLNGGAGGYAPANEVIATDKQRDAVQFFAIPLPKQ